jgi:hypothetical protein
MQVGLSLGLPERSRPVKALSRLAWVEGFEGNTRKVNMGLWFREITREARDAIVDFVVESQMPDLSGET